MENERILKLQLVCTTKTANGNSKGVKFTKEKH